MHFGHPTKEQCEAYTRVLQGHVRFPPSSFDKAAY
jgi:Xaa-Pro aminopeptidase